MLCDAHAALCRTKFDRPQWQARYEEVGVDAPSASAPLYDINALCSLAESALCATPFVHHVEVDPEELLALLAEFRRMQPVVRAAMELHLAKMNPVWLTEAVKTYLQQRADAGANGSTARSQSDAP